MALNLTSRVQVTASRFWNKRNAADPPLVPGQLFAGGTRAIDSAWASN